MRVLVAGSVNWTEAVPVETVLDQYLVEYPAMIVITGMAEGVDAIARRWAGRNCVDLWAESLAPGDYPVPMHQYNERMLSWLPDVVVACKPDLDLEQNSNAGTEHMCRIAAAAGVSVRWLSNRVTGH